MTRIVLLASLLFACSKSPEKKPEKLVESVAPLEALGFTFDRPAGVKLGEPFSPYRGSDCCRKIGLHGPDGYIGALDTSNIPSMWKTLDQYIAEHHESNTIVKKEQLPSGAFYVEFREPQDSAKSTVRIASTVTTDKNSADCYAMPADDKELEVARAVCRSLRPL